MARAPRIIRGAIGTGLTFAVGTGAVTTVVALLLIAAGLASPADLGLAGKLTVVAFLLGVAFSGMLAVTARSRRLAELSIPRFAALGAAAGLLYFLFIAVGALARWSTADAVANLVILPVLGAAAAAGTLLVARLAGAAPASGEAPRLLHEGGVPVGDVVVRERTSA